MAVAYFTKDTKLKTTDKHLFDVKTIATSYGRDLYVNSSGTINRIIGLDKLEQQVEKSVLIKKKTYTQAPLLGTNLEQSNPALVDFDIKESLAQLATLQQQQRSTNSFTILGRNIYRSRDSSNVDYWVKINSHIVSSNSFIDKDLTTGTTYSYATTNVYQDTLGRTTESKIDEFENVIVSEINTMSAIVNDSFIIVSSNNKVTLYWNLPIEMSTEEQLRSIISVNSSKLGDPRSLKVSIKVTNRNLTQAQINTLTSLGR